MKMVGRPVKFRILEYLYENGTTWNYKLIPDIMAEYGMKGDLERDNMNYDLIEMAASGFINPEQTIIDTEGVFRKDRPIFEYSLTNLGREQYEWLLGKIKGE